MITTFLCPPYAVSLDSFRVDRQWEKTDTAGAQVVHLFPLNTIHTVTAGYASVWLGKSPEGIAQPEGTAPAEMKAHYRARVRLIAEPDSDLVRWVRGPVPHPWPEEDPNSRKGRDMMVSFRMHAPDELRLWETVIVGCDPRAGLEQARSNRDYFLQRMEEDDARPPSRSDTLRQMSARAGVALRNAYNSQLRAIERMEKGTYVPAFVKWGDRVFSWEEWVDQRGEEALLVP